MRKIAIIVAIAATIGFAANAMAQPAGYLKAGNTIKSTWDSTNGLPDANGFPQTNVSYGAWVSGTDSTFESGTLRKAAVDAGSLTNGGTITLLEWMGGGTVENNGTITNVGAEGIKGGTLNNNNGGRITGTAYVTGGTLNNRGGATVGTAVLSAGTINNSNTVSASTVSGGTFNNSGLVSGTLTLTGGAFRNGYTSSGTGIGNVGTANITGGTFTNRDGSSVTTATLSGSGTLANNGSVGTLNYNGGTYNGGGGITTLNANANISDIAWGAVRDLNILSGGILDLTISGFVNGMFILSGFNGSATNVSVANDAQINVGLGTFVVENWLASFIGENTPGVGEDDATFNFGFSLFGTEVSSAVLLGGVFDEYGLSFSNGSLSLVVEAELPPPPQAPEPATLAIFGLGLVGLGLARARRRK